MRRPGPPTQHLGAGWPASPTGDLLAHQVDHVAVGADAAQDLLGQGDIELVLEHHGQLDGGQGVDAQVLAEPGLRLQALRIDIEVHGDDRAHARLRLGHLAHRAAAACSSSSIVSLRALLSIFPVRLRGITSTIRTWRGTANAAMWVATQFWTVSASTVRPAAGTT